jgi:hypothetical protein
VNTSKECMRGAFAAILRGDTAERDRLADRAKVLLAAEMQADTLQRVMSIDFFVTAGGLAIPSVMMAKAARVVQ